MRAPTAREALAIRKAARTIPYCCRYCAAIDTRKAVCSTVQTPPQHSPEAHTAAHRRAILRHGRGTQALADWEDFNLRGPL